MGAIFNILFSFIMVTLLTIVSCSEGEMEKIDPEYSTLDEVSDEAWRKLSKKTFYFGHHSVGFNILNGIRDLMEKNSKIKLNIIKTEEVGDLNDSAFAHFNPGKNGYPETKINDFVNAIESGIGSKTDFSFLKFCYVDVRTDSNVNEIFREYKKKMEKLAKSYPDTTFIHFTVPLTTELSKTQLSARYVKKYIMKIFGKPYYWPPAGNVNRNLLNEMIIAEYKEKAPIFDIAKIESTYLDGKRRSFKKDGKTYYSMVPDFTDDGAHLNEMAGRHVAEQLLIFLVNQI